MMWYPGVLLPLSAFLTLTHQQESAQVDLGYEIHEGYLNASTSLYKFANIRYAQPPVGELRFAAPVPPAGQSSQVENGSVPVLCPQGKPLWQWIAQEFVQYVLAGKAAEFNFTAAEEQLEALLETNPPDLQPDPATTEDCLFLDVVVPQLVFDDANDRRSKSEHWTENRGGAPVIVWIYGGGFTEGSKDVRDPSGLIKASQAHESQGIIFVAMNYRLGALGWLSGPTMQGSGGTPNAALLDQRLAIDWVRTNVHLFGGDPNKITIMGNSAGGGSVVMQITAYGGEKPVAFHRAVPQSPGSAASSSLEEQEARTLGFFSALNVTSLEEARQLDSAAVIAGNQRQIGAAPYGSGIYGPVVDGDFLPDTPNNLLASGAHAQDIGIMVGHQANEGPAFSPPYVQTDEDLRAYIANTYPGAPDEIVDYIVLVLYPAVYDGTYPYTSGLERTVLIISDLYFTCNTNAVNKAFENQTYAYEFQVPPPIHGLDVPYTFYDGQGDDLANGTVAAVAEVHQAYITNFIQSGDPNGPGLYPFPMQGSNASMNAWNVTGVQTLRDPTVNQRCVFWESAF